MIDILTKGWLVAHSTTQQWVNTIIIDKHSHGHEACPKCARSEFVASMLMWMCFPLSRWWYYCCSYYHPPTTRAVVLVDLSSSTIIIRHRRHSHHRNRTGFPPSYWQPMALRPGTPCDRSFYCLTCSGEGRGERKQYVVIVYGYGWRCVWLILCMVR